MFRLGAGKRILKKSQNNLKIGTLVRYRYPNWDLGVILEVKLNRKKEYLYLVRWPETNETLWMSDILLEIVSG